MEKREYSCAVGGNANWYRHYRLQYAAAAAKSLQSCLTLCNPTDGSPPGSPVPGILQARTLEWVAISFSNAWKWKVKVKSPSHVQLLVTTWTAAYQAPPSMGFSRLEYWSGLPLPSPRGQYGDSSIKLGIKPPYDPGIPLVGILYPDETKIEKHTCIPLCTAALFTTARTWKQPRCPLTDEWIKKLWYIYTMEYYSDL